jgi:long-chain fatty acid transport protein
MPPQRPFPLLFALIPLGEAAGSGFQLQERSAAGLGRAFSGEAAIGDDASVIASNPAAMTLLAEEWSFALGASAIFPEVEVDGRYSPPAPAPPGTVLPAPAGNVADDAFIPYFHAAKRVHERLGLGFSAFTIYGLNSNYPTSFPARAVADSSEVMSLNLNPSLAWRIDDRWSVGLGFNALYADGKLTSTAPSTLPLLDLAGDDWGYGFNAGLLFEAGPGTRFGLHYRSAIELEIEGRAVSVFPAFNGAASLAVELPDSLEFSAVHDLGDGSIHGDVMWTGWSVFQELAPRIGGAPAQPPATAHRWQDSWRFALGATWRATETWTFRAGIAYDRSPAPAANLTLRIPDADRFWLSAGLSWEFSPGMTLDFGYAHIFADDIPITDGNAASGVFRGSASGGADVVSLGIATTF